jgi:formylglycine-generating enzyme required for sulfatase activity
MSNKTITLRRIRAIVISFCAVLATCAPLISDRDRPVDYTISGMKKITATGKSFSQGWNDSRSSLDERPGMQGSFTYDYWFDSTEVTQGQYYAATGRRPVDSGSVYGFGDDYPVYRVSWFDAVLYCNARSRLEGLDTVYMHIPVRSRYRTALCTN